MTIYEKNLEFFKNYLDVVYKTITEEKNNYDTIIEDIEDNMNCIVQNQDTRCFIHSIYSKDREIKEAFENADFEGSILVIFGLGFGNSMKYISENFKELKELIIIEPDLNLFRRILKSIDISDIQKFFLGKNVTFIINKTEELTSEALTNKLNKSANLKLEFIENIAYKSLYNGYIGNVKEGFIKSIRQIKTNVATNDSSKEMWASNIIKNIMIKPDSNLESFIDKFENKTAIIVSAGPSLNKNIHLLKKVKDKAIIFAPGSAIKILDSYGIVPDFRFAMDAWESENRVFTDINTSSTALVYSNSIYDEILPSYKGKKINMVLNTDFLSKYIYNKLKISVVEINSGYSIANVVLSVVAKMRFKKVIFMGQDLCYTNGELYAKGSWTKEKMEGREGLIKTKDIYGEDVYTISPFLSMKYLFENIIASNFNIEYINATEGGLRLEGATNKKFEECLIDLNKSENIEDIKKSVFMGNKNEDYENRTFHILLDIQKECEQILQINNERLKKIKRLSRYIEKGMGINKLYMELENIDKYNEKLNEGEFYKEVIIPVLRDTFYAIESNYGYNGEDKQKIVISKETIWEGYSSQVDKYLRLLMSLIDEVKNKFIKFE
ncbi:motility associated factor glycosyltransferase family protein [Clostridium grantii]|uniref:Uncharacterized conserved protein n=1 Tax=Clostridium grantii DSM 8605 TaxID=1121316 RepID=A0A1M5W7C7_9CLOT|nr:6-hydroxymethylpterin diphosphokinase MptE-like protein [Clostridium grantii]SHH83328.1 Uncharacterized conserved protein [Clostridium grantii DSM 8605]